MIWSDPDELNARVPVSINKITDDDYTNQLLDNQTLT